MTAVLFVQLSKRARTALLLLMVPVAAVSMGLGPDTEQSRLPQGVVVTRDDTHLMVRTADGQQHTGRVDAADSRHCTGGTTYPACLTH